MTKKDYIFNMSNLIRNRVFYHAPISYDGLVDFDDAKKKGIDLSLPVFIIEKPISRALVKAFVEAEKECEFNVVIRDKNKYALRKIKHCFYVKKGELNSLEKLNINYKTMSNYYMIERGNYLKINGVKADYQQIDFYEEFKQIFDGTLVEIKRFLLNGENFMFEICNTQNKQQIIDVEYNRDLERGYYKFYKLRNSLKILNLCTNKEFYFNASFGKIDERFSCVDGVENSTFARINFKAKVLLKPFEKRCLFFNFGESHFSLKNRGEIVGFFDISQKESFQTFNVKIESNDKVLERNFNRVLPLKIWKSWIEGKRDVEAENKYLTLKEKLLLVRGKRVLWQKEIKGIQSVFMYNGKSYKKIANS